MSATAPKDNKPSLAEQRKRTALVHKAARFAVQIAFFILAPGVFSGAFNGVKYLFTQLGLGEPIELTAFVMLLIGVLVFTVVFGRFFCGYACAFGTLGDVLYTIPEFIRSKTSIPRLRFPLPLVRVLSFCKYIVLACVCIACFLGVWSAYSGYSPWVAFSAALAGSIEGVDQIALVLLGVVAVCMIVRERFFCQFLCPLGAVFALMPVLGISELSRTREHCARSCDRCQHACPVDIWPDADKLEHGECIACGRCADACPMGNVNLVAIEHADARKERLEKDGDELRPIRKVRETWRFWRGTGIVFMLVKALLFLALCWALGATRYIPAFSDVVGRLPLPF